MNGLSPRWSGSTERTVEDSVRHRGAPLYLSLREQQEARQLAVCCAVVSEVDREVEPHELLLEQWVVLPVTERQLLACAFGPVYEKDSLVTRGLLSQAR
jgi:hypothetical protein